MALTKRTYVDGETIITAQNLNDIQDEIIAHESNKVPITRTVNSKALSANITLSASDVGAVPTTRTVNSKALSSDITLAAADIGYNSTNVGAELGSLNGAISDCISANVEDATTIPNGTDYDTLTTPGNYVCPTSTAGQTMTNAPATTSHRLYVIQNVANNRLTQIALLNTQNASFLLRTYTSSGWSVWKEPSYRVQSQLVANVEEDTTATQSYSVGDFLAIAADLYRVTSSIANGGTISTSTNVSSTTVADELKSLNSFADGLYGIQRYSFGLAAKTTKTFNIGSSKYGMMFSLGTSSTLLEFLIYRTTSTGVIAYAQVFNASGLTISKTNNKLTTANTTSSATQIVFITLSPDTITVDT